MRDYSFNTKISKWQLYFNYVAQLDQQIGNLYDYIKEYNPNYQILNDSRNYYSTNDLKKLKLYNDATHIINASFLNCHQGLLNNFHQDCIIDFGVHADEVKVMVPAFNLYTVLNPDNVQYIESTSAQTQKSIYDLKGLLVDQMILPEGYILLSQVKSNNLSNTSQARKDIKNYLFARVAAPATYYILNNIISIPTIIQNTDLLPTQKLNCDYIKYQNQYYEGDETQYKVIDASTIMKFKIRYTWTHTPNAELTHGVSQYYSFLPNGTNFYYYQPYNTPPVEKRQITTINSPDILTQDGSQGVEGYALNHRLIDKNTHEEIVCDDTYAIDTIAENKIAIARYNITIRNDKEPFLESFPMMVRLG